MTTRAKKSAGVRPTTKKKPFVRAKHAGKLAPKANAKTGEKVYAQRSDKGAPASVAIERLPMPHKAVARALDAMIRKVVPGAQGVVKWGNAVYAVNGQSFTTIYQTKAGMNLALPAALIDDPAGLLEGTGKTMRHIKMPDATSVNRPAVHRLVRAAAKVGMKGM